MHKAVFDPAEAYLHLPEIEEVGVTVAVSVEAICGCDDRQDHEEEGSERKQR